MKSIRTMDAETNDTSKRKRIQTDDSDPDAVETTASSTPGRSERSPLIPSDRRDPPVPKRVACNQCRQSKLRCDSPKDPCSRCERLGLSCMTDKGYRRVNKRSKIDDLEKVVMQLQARVVNPPPTHLMPWAGLPVCQEATPAERTNVGNAGTYPQYPDAPAQETLLSPEDESVLAAAPLLQNGAVYSRSAAVKARAVDSTALGTNEIDALFNLYFDHFHPFFPLLHAGRSPDMYYDRSQLLFWTVISVASRRYSADPSLQPTLAKTVMDLCWKVIADPPLTYASVQGILILCMWPPSIIHLWSDASTSLSNIAMVAAMHMGLHRPDHVREFTRTPRGSGSLVITEADKLERKKTWAACNIVSQYTIVNIGYPPTASCFDWSIERACEAGGPHSVPDELRYHLIIQKFCYRTTKAMSDNVSDPLGLPSDEQFEVVMKLLELDLATLEGQLKWKLSIIDKLNLRGARLHLEVQWWLGQVWSDQKRKGILKSYATASALINDFVSADSSYQVLSYGPIIFPRMLFSAAYITLRVLTSKLSERVDISAGETLFHSAVSCIRRYSCHEMDITARAAGIISDVWEHRDEIFRNEKNKEPTLISKSRLAGSMTFDCLWRWKDKYPEKRVGTGNYRPANSWAPAEGEPQNTSAAEAYDPIASSFDWTMFDDFDWPWTFDAPPVALEN